jgi:hypothetical protein
MVPTKFDNDVAKPSVVWWGRCVDEADCGWKVGRIPVSICRFLKFCASQVLERLDIVFFGYCVDLLDDLVGFAYYRAVVRV